MAEYKLLNDLDQTTDFHSILVRVLRKWNLYDKHAPTEVFCINFLLVDEEGTKIQASVLKRIAHERFTGISETRIYQFQTFSVELNDRTYRASSHQYRLSFNPHTVFFEHNGEIPRPIPRVAYSFKPIPEILTISRDQCEEHLIDVYGFVKSMGSLEEFNRDMGPKQFLTMQLTDASDNSIECILFDKCASDTAAAYQESSHTIIVVVLNLCRVSWTQDKERQLTSSFHATKVYLNQNIEEVNCLISTLEARSTLETTQFKQSVPTQRSHVSGGKPLCTQDIIPLDNIVNQEAGEAFHVKCELIKLESRYGWQYDGCAKCASIPRPQDPSNPKSPLWCSFCKRKPSKIEPKLKVTYTVRDDTDTALLTFWNTAAIQLVKKTAIQLKDELPAQLKDTPAFPADLNKQVGKTLILKLKRNFYNTQNPGSSISVSEVTSCEDLLQQFNAESSQGIGSAAEGSSSAISCGQSSQEVNVPQQSVEIVPTVDLAEEEKPLASLAQETREVQLKNKRRMTTAKEGRKETTSGGPKSGMLSGSAERVLKNIKQEK